MSARAAAASVSGVRDVYLPRLRQLRDEAMLRASKTARLSPVAHEWAKLGREHRIVFLMLAGIDDVEEMTLKAWGEYTPPEQHSLRIVMRAMRAAVGGLNALVRS